MQNVCTTPNCEHVADPAEVVVTTRSIRALNSNSPQTGLRRKDGKPVNITQVTSPNGRWIAFTYDASNRITPAKDSIGRTVTYGYEGAGRLCVANSHSCCKHV